MDKKVSIITLTYNKLHKATKPYLEFLLNKSNDFELIIVDNGSTDGTVEYLKNLENKYDNIKVIYNKENLGFSVGCNQGIKAAKGEIIGFLNNDILFSIDWLKPIFEIFDKEDKAAFVSANPIESYEFSKCEFEKIIKHISSCSTLSYEPCIKPSFSCVFVKKSVLDEIGLFDENFSPAYFEDDDLICRAVFAGYENFVSNDVYFYHLGALTGKSLPALNNLLDKNKKYFFEKYSDKFFVKCIWKIEDERMYLKKMLSKKRKKSIFYFIKKLTGANVRKKISQIKKCRHCL